MIPLCISAIEDDDDRFFMQQIFYQYQRLLYHTIHQYTHDPWDTEDIFQSVFPKLIEKLALLKKLSRAQRTNYIISAAKNTAINYLVKKSNRKETFLEDVTTPLPAAEDPYQFVGGDSEDVTAFRRIWPKLDARSQYLLEARYILHKPYEEIALDLNIKPGSVRVAMTRTREKAKRLILAEKDAAHGKESVSP